MTERLEYRPTVEKPSLRTRILNILAEVGLFDKMMQKRAIDTIERSKIMNHLKQGGVYLDIGTGLGHIVERIVKEDENKDIKF